jgi:hypothetical protein
MVTTATGLASETVFRKSGSTEVVRRRHRNRGWRRSASSSLCAPAAWSLTCYHRQPDDGAGAETCLQFPFAEDLSFSKCARGPVTGQLYYCMRSSGRYYRRRHSLEYLCIRCTRCDHRDGLSPTGHVVDESRPATRTLVDFWRCRCIEATGLYAV